MKKLLSCLVVILVSISASAQVQFYQYKPYQPSNNNNSYDYSDSYQSTSPFYYYRPYSNNRQTVQPKAKTFNLTGYYKDSKGWHSAPIKVTVTEDKIVLSAFKYGNYWMNNAGTVSGLDYYDSDEVKENFNYKARTTHLGVVYF